MLRPSDLTRLGMAAQAPARRFGSPGYRHARVDALVGAAAVSSLVFIWLIAVPAVTPARLVRHAGHLPLLWTHILGGTVMLLAGAAALRIGLTRSWFRWHRPAGYIYLATGALTSLSAIVRSFDATHTPGLSTGTLGAVWLVFAAMAYRAVKNRRLDQHRDWMIRAYVAAWTFVFCRFFERAAPGVIGGTENDAIWFTWIAPVLLCEVALQWKRGAAKPYQLEENGRAAIRDRA
jgi:hypothetical protein